jgi:hypothetical protein
MKLVVDLSRPMGDPERERMVPLTPEEIAENRGDPRARMYSSLSAARNAENWACLAERLRRGADVILREKHGAPLFEEDARPSPSFWLGAVHMMLLGQAVEVAAKGLLVAQDPARVDQSRPRTPFIWRDWGHDLARLLRETKITVSQSEERTAHLLKSFIEWGGRYPSPMNLNTAKPLEWTSDDVASAEALYDRLETLLKTAAREQTTRDGHH